MFKSFEAFTYSSKENFPIDECVIQDEREPDVFNANTVYQVLYIDLRFPKEKMITYAKPYVWNDENGISRFGWISTYTSEIFGNVENSCQFYDEFVIGFIRANENYQEEDNELFKYYKQLIEGQYDTWSQS
jgi:hypothetical protein